MKSAAFASAIVYTGLAAAVALLFLAGAWAGPYSSLECIGGAAWVFFLSLIILMPVVTQWRKRRSSQDS